jgi:hypothetical protein
MPLNLKNLRVASVRLFTFSLGKICCRCFLIVVSPHLSLTAISLLYLPLQTNSITSISLSERILLRLSDSMTQGFRVWDFGFRISDFGLVLISDFLKLQLKYCNLQSAIIPQSLIHNPKFL